MASSDVASAETQPTERQAGNQGHGPQNQASLWSRALLTLALQCLGNRLPARRGSSRPLPQLSTTAIPSGPQTHKAALAPKLHTCLSIAHLRLAVGPRIAKVGQHRGDGASRGALAGVNLQSARGGGRRRMRAEAGAGGAEAGTGKEWQQRSGMLPHAWKGSTGGTIVSSKLWTCLSHGQLRLRPRIKRCCSDQQHSWLT